MPTSGPTSLFNLDWLKQAPIKLFSSPLLPHPRSIDDFCPRLVGESHRAHTPSLTPRPSLAQREARSDASKAIEEWPSILGAHGSQVFCLLHAFTIQSIMTSWGNFQQFAETYGDFVTSMLNYETCAMFFTRSGSCLTLGFSPLAMQSGFPFVHEIAQPCCWSLDVQIMTGAAQWLLKGEHFGARGSSLDLGVGEPAPMVKALKPFCFSPMVKALLL